MVKKQVKKKTIKKAVEEKPQSQEKILEESEPSWYHYVIVLLVIGVVFGIFYVGVSYYQQSKQPETTSVINNSIKSYIHKYEIDGKVYNLEFQHSFEEIEGFDYPVEINKYDILNSKNLSLSFLSYNGTDNKGVSIVSVKLTRFMKYVYGMKFETGNFMSYDDGNCSVSTVDEKIMVFNPYSDRAGVFYDETSGCIEVLATDADEMVRVGDKFLYELIGAEVN